LMERISKGKFDLEDFREYIQQLGKAGPMEKLLEMIPGISGRMQYLDMSSEEMRKWVAIINSMTPEERRDPSLIRGSRIERIARGAGVTAKEVRKLLKSYNQAKKFIESISSESKAMRLFRRMGISG